MSNPTPRDSAQLLPFPHHPEHAYIWLDSEKRVIQEYAEAYAREALRAQAASVEPVPIGVEAIAEIVTRQGELAIDWLVEGGINAVPEGTVLIMAHQPITDDNGHGGVYTAPQPQAVAASSPATAVDAVDWQKVNAVIDEYVDGYEFRGDGGDYSPNERETLLIADAINGLMADDEFLAALQASRQPRAQQAVAVGAGEVTILCKTCGADRLKEPCAGYANNCPIQGTAS